MEKRIHSYRSTWDDFVKVHEFLFPKLGYEQQTYIRYLFWAALRAYFKSKRDVAEHQTGHILFSYRIRPRFGYSEAAKEFASLNAYSAPYLRLHCDERLEQKAASTYPAVKLYGDRSGMHIQLDGSIPPEELIAWIDAAYSRRKAEVEAREQEFQAMVDKVPVDEEKLRRLIAFCDLEKRTDDILSVVRPSFWIELRAAESIARGQSKFGGLPDLPPDMEYPTFKGKPLGFVAQINLAELPNDAAKADLPQRGILYFFTIWLWHNVGEPEAWDNPEAWRVLYYDDARLTDEEPILPEMIDMFVEEPVAVEFYPRMMLPDPADLEQSNWAHYERELYAELYDRFLYIQKNFFDDPQNRVPCHWLRGYCESIQHPMTPSGKKLLLQLDSDEKVFEWGYDGGGRLYYFISDENLKQCNFSNVDFQLDD